MNVSILLVDYNSIERTCQYVEELRGSCGQSEDVSYVIVDNSADHRALVEERLGDLSAKRITYAVAEGNLGYAKGNNLAADLARENYAPDYYLISNNDIFLNHQSLGEILGQTEVAFSQWKDAGIIGPDVQAMDGSHQSPRVKKGWFSRLFVKYAANLLGPSMAAKQGDYVQNPADGPCDWVMGCFFFVKADCFHQVGGFDENTFLYGEELILSTRLRSWGYKTYYLSSASITHNHQEGTGSLPESIKKELTSQKRSFTSDLYYYKAYEKLPAMVVGLAKIWFGVYSLLARLEKGFKALLIKQSFSTLLLWLLVTLAASFFTLVHYVDLRFDISFGEVLYTLKSKTTGAGADIIKVGLRYCIPRIILWDILFFLFSSLVIGGETDSRKSRFKWFLLPGLLMTACLLVAGLCFADKSFGIREYYELKKNPTTIYEDYYRFPEIEQITSSGTTKNLIYIWLESMENTYAAKELGGQQERNLIPNLTEMSEKYLSFSNTDKLGGFRSPEGTVWTMGALFAASSGVPFAFPVDGNSMENYSEFAPGITALGDVLEAKGYHNMFLCGSDVNFAGRGNFYRQHGNYEIIDYYVAKEKSYIPEDYYVWWGLEDAKLYEIAKTELVELAQKGEPFSLTMLTVDTHYNDGYICSLCKEDYEDVASRVVACADRQIRDFVEWLSEQDFFEDTVVIITGDHPRMDTCLVEGIKRSKRTMYNCFIGSAKMPQGDIKKRSFTTMDLFPTTLSAMGFDIPDHRLGLGVDLFSGEETLTERLGFTEFNEELKKYSPFYEEHFD